MGNAMAGRLLGGSWEAPGWLLGGSWEVPGRLVVISGRVVLVNNACSSPDLLTKIGSGSKHASRVGESFSFETQGVSFMVKFR